MQCTPGLSGGTPDPHAAALRGHTVVHLPGVPTPAVYDGWAQNLFAPGQHAVFHYPMDQRAALLWYHDHVMGATRFDVYAGLAGLWVIRDERERELGLPEGPPYEVPLLLQDRNFGLDESARLTGELVHKTDPDVMEAFAPFTVVNGKVWPVLDLQPATYRFRAINGSNARTFRSCCCATACPSSTASPRSAPTRVCSASPLRSRPTAWCSRHPSAPTCSSTSRTFPPGAELTLFNTARAPFDGASLPATDAADAADLDGLLPYPQVMCFRVVPGPPAHVPCPASWRPTTARQRPAI